jgi:hypothetical protein
MSIASSLAAVVLSSSLAGAAAPVTSSIPPTVVTVATSPDVPPTLVARVLAEADAVWRAGGITFVWRRAGGDAAPVARTVEAPPCADATLRVDIGDDHGRADGNRDARTPLGWIRFDDPETPNSEIYLSYENALTYLAGSRAVTGLIDRMPIAEREMLLARVMGRALAHEIGHYLLASKVHTPRGLMQAAHTASDFFGADRKAFAIDAAQRQVVAARLRPAPLTAVLHDVR